MAKRATRKQEVSAVGGVEMARERSARAYVVEEGVSLHLKREDKEAALCGLLLTAPVRYVSTVMPHDHPGACGECVATQRRRTGEGRVAQPVLVRR
jgi:hypothetical protein